MLMLAAMLTLCFSINVFAAESTNESSKIIEYGLSPVEEHSEDILAKGNGIVYDEYDVYTALQERSEKELKAEKYTDEEITMIKENTYESLLRERGKLSAEELKNIGYNSEEIAILQDPDSTDGELRTLSAT